MFIKVVTICGSGIFMTDLSLMRINRKWKTTGSNAKFVRPTLRLTSSSREVWWTKKSSEKSAETVFLSQSQSSYFL